MGSETLSEEEQQLKNRFRRECGYWPEGFDDLLRIDPEFVEIVLDITSHPLQTGSLDRKTKEFLYIALNAATTHLYEDGIRRHISNAFDEGASIAEVLQVIQLSSVLGVHSFAEGVPILAERLGLPEDFSDEALAEHERIKERFEELRGFWDERWRPIMVLDPTFFEHYLRYSSHPSQNGDLDPKVRELVLSAIDLSTTHLFPDGAQIHINNAVEHGATRDEIVEMLQIAFSLSNHTIEQSVPILVEEAEKHGLVD